ncbi:MAG: helix-turn-helix domain-containing protein [Bacteroidota bacterium]
MENTFANITPRCPIRTTLDLLGGKWKLLILYQLYHGPLRTSELKRKIPEISEKMLIQELKVLTINELVVRKNYREVPPRVEYALTEKGQLAMPLIEEMKRFAEAYTQAV